MQVLDRPTLIFAQQYTIGIPEAKKSPNLNMITTPCHDEQVLPPLTSWVQTTSSARGTGLYLHAMMMMMMMSSKY